MDIEAGHVSTPHTINIDPISLLVDSHPATLTLKNSYISWTINGGGCHSMQYSEILCALPANNKPPSYSLSIYTNLFQSCGMGPFPSIALVDAHIFGFRRSASCPSNYHPLKITISSTKESIDEILNIISAGIAAVSGSRPRRLLLLLNPSAGKGAARPAFNTIVRPVLSMIGAQLLVYETEYSGHAKELVRSVVGVDEGIDGILAVGGDGIFNEVLNAFLEVLSIASKKCKEAVYSRHTHHSNDVRVVHRMDSLHGNDKRIKESIMELERLHSIRLAHIPCGSTDAVACSLHGSRSIFTATMHVALGDVSSFDVLRIDTWGTHTNNGDGGGEEEEGEGRHTSRRWACCIATLGFMSDVVQQAGHYDWLRGTLRYDVLGAVVLLRNASYACRIDYVPAVDLSSTPCYACCDVCRSAVFSCVSKLSSSTTTGAAVPWLCDSFFSENAAPDTKHSSWTTLQGEFMSVMAINQPCRSEKTPRGMSRHGHLSNGQCTLVAVSKCSPWQYLQFLLVMSSQGLVPGTLPEFVKVVHVTALRVHRLGDGPHSLWNIDGELENPAGMTSIQSCCGLVKVFARGVEST